MMRRNFKYGLAAFLLLLGSSKSQTLVRAETPQKNTFHLKKALDNYITGTFYITPSTQSYPTSAFIILDDAEAGGSSFLDTPPGKLSGSIPWVYVPSTYTVYTYGITPGSTVVVSTDAGVYYGDTNGVVHNVVVNSSVNVYIY